MHQIEGLCKTPQDGPLRSDLERGLSLDLDHLHCEGVGGAQRHGPPPAVWERAGKPLGAARLAPG